MPAPILLQLARLVPQVFGRRGITAAAAAVSPRGFDTGRRYGPFSLRAVEEAARELRTPRPSMRQLMDFYRPRPAPSPRSPSESPNINPLGREADVQETHRSFRQTGLAIGALGTAAFAAKISLKDWSAGIEESSQGMAIFSSQVASAVAVRKRAEVIMAVQRGGLTGFSIAELLKARTEREQAALPVLSEIKNLTNTFGTLNEGFWKNFWTGLDALGVDETLKSLDDNLRALLGLEKRRDKKDQAPQAEFRKFLNDIAEGRYHPSPTPEEQRANQRRLP